MNNKKYYHNILIEQEHLIQSVCAKKLSRVIDASVKGDISLSQNNTWNIQYKNHKIIFRKV